MPVTLLIQFVLFDHKYKHGNGHAASARRNKKLAAACSAKCASLRDYRGQVEWLKL
jgi:hypothetical protein